MMKHLVYLRGFTILIGVIMFSQCETTEVCASCADPDFTAFLFDTTAGGFNPSEIDSFYIIGIARDELTKPNDTSQLFIRQNPFLLDGNLFNASTLTNDYIIEGVNQEFRFEITDLSYTIINADDDCLCDYVEDKSLRINGEFVSLPNDPFEYLVLPK